MPELLVPVPVTSYEAAATPGFVLKSLRTVACGAGLGSECNFANSSLGKIEILDPEILLKGKKKKKAFLVLLFIRMTVKPAEAATELRDVGTVQQGAFPLKQDGCGPCLKVVRYNQHFKQHMQEAHSCVE